MIRTRTLPLILTGPLLGAALVQLLLIAMAQVSPCSAQVVVAIGQNFTASTFNVDSNGDPPDSNGAAGQNHFVELINGRFSVFDKATGAKMKTSTDFVFWQQAG